MSPLVLALVVILHGDPGATEIATGPSRSRQVTARPVDQVDGWLYDACDREGGYWRPTTPELCVFLTIRIE